MGSWEALSNGANFYFNVFMGMGLIIATIMLVVHSVIFAQASDKAQERANASKNIIIILFCTAALSGVTLIVNLLFFIAFRPL